MANLTESAKWETGIFQIETSTPALGGADGPANTQAKQLANRTQYLKSQIDTVNTTLKTAAGSAGSINARIAAVEKTTQQGNFNFGSTEGTTIAASIGNTNYSVHVEPNATTNGDLGDVYVDRTNNAFTVYNTGGYTGSGRYQITK